MIKAVTFQAAQNFKANLYALELKSRFIDQTKANGFYKGYGNELSHTVSGTSAIVINSGAFLVQGRAVEIVSSESVAIAFENGKVGYIVARIETKPADNVPNCTLVAKTGSTLSGITLTQQDVYQYSAESSNKIYELPLYSFGMQNNAIQNVVKLITAIEEITTIKQTADTAIATANGAVTTANTANSTANTARNTANAAQSTANTANGKADTNAAAITTINERLENLGFKSGTFSFGGATQNIYREGNLVYCAANYTKHTAQYEGFTLAGTLCTLPAQFRPQASYTASVSAYFNVGSTYTNYGVAVTVNTDGTVVAKSVLNVGYQSAQNHDWHVNLVIGHKCPPIS